MRSVGTDRDILLHDGPINLDDYKWQVWELTVEEQDDWDSSQDLSLIHI